MTVKTTKFVEEFAGDDSTVTFSLPWPFLDRAHLVATKYLAATPDVQIPLTVASVTGAGLDAGWGLTLSAPVGTGYTLRVRRSTPVTQERDYVPSDPFPAKSHELGLDKLTMIIQEMIASASSTGGPIFSEGPEVDLRNDLLPGKFGFATDTQRFIFKLADGTIVVVPIAGEGEGVETWGVKYFNANFSDIDLEPSPNSYDAFPEQEGEYSVFGSDEFDPMTGAEMRCDGFFKPWPIAHALGFSVLILDKNGAAKIVFSANQQSGAYRLQPTYFWHSVRVFPTENSSPSAGYFSFDFEATYRVEPATEESHTGWQNLSAVLLPEDGPYRIALAIACGGNSHHARLGNKIVYSKVSLGGGSPGAQLIGDAGGDLSGTYPDPTVVGLRGKALPALAPGLLVYNGTQWAFLDLSGIEFVRKSGDTMTGRLEFGTEGGSANGGIEKKAEFGFNYLNIEQEGPNAHISLSTENNSGDLTTKIRVGPEGVDIFAPTSFTSLTGEQVAAEYVDFSSDPPPPQEKGRTFWDDAALCLKTYLRASGGQDTQLNHGQEIMVPCLNNTGATIPNFSAVYTTGASGERMTIALADADNPAKTRAIGVTTEEIADGEVGFVTFFGDVHNVDTSGFVAGSVVYLDTTPGGIVSVKPSAAGATCVCIGTVLSSDPTEGIVHVDPIRYPWEYELSGNSIVSFTGAYSGYVARWMRFTGPTTPGSMVLWQPAGGSRVSTIQNNSNGILELTAFPFTTIRHGSNDLSSLTLLPGQHVTIIDGGLQLVTVSNPAVPFLYKEVQLLGDAKVGSNPPTLADAFTPTGSPVAVQLYQFAANATNRLSGAHDMPHDWREGDPMSLHIHYWVPANVAAGNIVWFAAVRTVDAANGSTPTDQYFQVTDSVPANVGGTERTVELGSLVLTGKKISFQLCFTFGRLGADASDNWSGEPFVTSFAAHYRKDSLGSTSETTKY